MDLRLCSTLARGHIASTWYRAVDPPFLFTATSTLHTATITSRFSPATRAIPAFEILYLAENPMVAMFEAGGLFGSPTRPGGMVPNPTRSLVTLAISVSVSDVLDLTDPAQARSLNTNAQELTGDWQSYGNRAGGSPHAGKAPTQDLGEELFRLRFKGFVSYSARLSDYKIFGVFTGLLAPPDKIEYSFHDPHGVLQTVAVP